MRTRATVVSWCAMLALAGCGEENQQGDCGDGVVDTAAGEECDDGNAISGDGCQANCVLPICGDGVIDDGEQCDDGNSVAGDGCSKDCSSDDATPPHALSTSPVDGELNVPITASVSITFDEEIDQSTLSSVSFGVSDDSGSPVSGTVVTMPTGGTFTPDAALAENTTYTAHVTTAVTDTVGIPLAAPVSWTFTTQAPRAWGTAELIETDDGGDAVLPHVAVDSAGNAIAVWNQSTGTTHQPYANRYVADTGWGSAEQIGTNNSYSVEVVVDADGNAIAAWHSGDINSQRIRSARYAVGFGWGSAPIVESDTTNLAFNPQLAMDTDGSAVAVWIDFGASTRLWFNRYVPGTGWATAELVRSGGIVRPQVVVHGGTAIVVWVEGDGTRLDIWARRYEVGSGLGAAELIETDDTGDADEPEIAIDSTGNVVAVWSQWDGTQHRTWANRYVAGIGWGTAELIQTNDTGSAWLPDVAVDPAGNAVAVWSHFANRYVAGVGWGSPEDIASMGGGIKPRVAVDAAGNAIAVWQQSDGIRQNIWANRYVAGTGWGTAELIETNQTGTAENADVAVGPAGNAVAIWEQSDGTQKSIWVNHYR